MSCLVTLMTVKLYVMELEGDTPDLPLKLPLALRVVLDFLLNALNSACFPSF